MNGQIYRQTDRRIGRSGPNLVLAEGSTLQAVTDAHGVDAHGVGANSVQLHGLGEPFTAVLPVYNRP